MDAPTLTLESTENAPGAFHAAHGSPSHVQITPSVETGIGAGGGVGGVRPYYDAEGVTIYHADCLDVLRYLPRVQLILTDPPYSSGGAFRSDRSQPTDRKYQMSGEGVQCFREYATFSGDNRDQRSFEKWCAEWMRQCLGMVGEGGALGCFIDWRNLACVIDAVQVAGWVYRGCVPWHKGWDQRPRKGWFRANVEYVIWGSAGVMLTGHKAEGECADGVVYHRINGLEKEHQTQKPVEVLADLMRVRPEWQTVLDPFMGSGTTLVAAKQCGKRAIGIDVSEQNCEIAARRCSQEMSFGLVGGGGRGGSETSPTEAKENVEL